MYIIKSLWGYNQNPVDLKSHTQPVFKQRHFMLCLVLHVAPRKRTKLFNW